MQLAVAAHIFYDVFIVGVGSPGKVVDVVAHKAPGAFFARYRFKLGIGFIVAPTNGRGVLQQAGAAQFVVFVDVDGNIVIAPNAIKLAGHIVVGIPALGIVLGHFGVPLGYAVAYVLFAVAATAAAHFWHLCVKVGCKNQGLFWQ